MSKILIGSRESKYYLWRYHDEDFPFSATIDLCLGEAHDRRGTPVKLHWSRNSNWDFKFIVGRNHEGSPAIKIKLPKLFFMTLSIPYFIKHTAHPSDFGIDFHHNILWVRFNADTTGWAERDWSFEWSLDLKRFFLGSYKSEETTIKEKKTTTIVPETKNYDEEEITVQLKLYENESWRSYLPFWTNRQKYVEVRSNDGIKHPGKGTTSYNCGEDRLIGTSYKLEDLDKDDIWESAIDNFIQDGLENRDTHPK